jgi:hypothetical protein
MEEFVAKKRVSIYLVLICWGFAVAMMHPGFAMIVTGSLLLFLLFVLRFIAHFEGQYMLKAAEAAHPAQPHLSRAVVFRHLGFELAITLAFFVVLTVALVTLASHVPWLWFSGGGS